MSKSKVSGDIPKKESKGLSKNIKRPRKLNPLPTKIVIRHLPPTLTSEQFIEQVGPISDHNYYYYVKGDLSLGEHSYSRAYINFIDQKDILHFREKFDNYVFVDDKGNEYPAIVELALYQGVPKRRKKIDARCNTIENDPNFLQFIEEKENKSEANLPTVQDCLEEIEAKEKEAKTEQHNITTPLLDYINNRKLVDSKLGKSSRDDKRKDDGRRNKRESKSKSITKQNRESIEIKSPSSNTIIKSSTSSKDKSSSDLKESKNRFRRRREDRKSKIDNEKSVEKRQHHEKLIDAKNQTSSKQILTAIKNDDTAAPKTAATFSVRILPSSKIETVADKLAESKEKKSQTNSGEKIRNKDRPSIQIYKPRSLKNNDTINKTSQDRTSRN